MGINKGVILTSTVVNGKTNTPVIINKMLISHLLVITEVHTILLCYNNLLLNTFF